jgi:hypothetical protein
VSKRKNNIFWPRVDTEDFARAACRNGGGMALIVAVITGLFSGLGAAGVEFAVNLGMDVWGFADAALFALCGWGMFRCSRAAAVAALLVFVAARIMLLRSGVSAGSILAIFVILTFVGAVRGTFAMHRLRQEAAGPGTHP